MSPDCRRIWSRSSGWGLGRLPHESCAVHQTSLRALLSSAAENESDVFPKSILCKVVFKKFINLPSWVGKDERFATCLLYAFARVWTGGQATSFADLCVHLSSESLIRSFSSLCRFLLFTHWQPVRPFTHVSFTLFSLWKCIVQLPNYLPKFIWVHLESFPSFSAKSSVKTSVVPTPGIWV